MQGCNGGDVHLAFQYMIDNKACTISFFCVRFAHLVPVDASQGVDTEKSYPYTDYDSKKCKFVATNVGATMSAMGMSLCFEYSSTTECSWLPALLFLQYTFSLLL
jgi:hypothetical protein